MDAQLVLHTDAFDVIAIAKAAIGIDQVLGDKKQRDAFDPWRRFGSSGENEVDDVVGHLMFAPRDEYLGPLDPPGAVVLRPGLGPQRTNIGACFRLGERHGSRPLAADQFLQVGGLELFAAMVLERLDGTRGQHRTQRKRHVGCGQHLLDGRGHHPGESVTAVFHVSLDGGPARLDELLIGGHHLIRDNHTAIVVAGNALGIAYGVGWRNDFGKETTGFIESVVDVFSLNMLKSGIGGQPLQIDDVL